MAENQRQTEEKNKAVIQNLKEKYQSEIEKFEKENNDLKVRLLREDFFSFNRESSRQKLEHSNKFKLVVQN